MFLKHFRKIAQLKIPVQGSLINLTHIWRGRPFFRVRIFAKNLRFDSFGSKNQVSFQLNFQLSTDLSYEAFLFVCLFRQYVRGIYFISYRSYYKITIPITLRNRYVTQFSFYFLLYSTYEESYWSRENYRLPVLDGFTCFGMS